ncbi:MAG: metallophosphoesterase [Chlorobiaceae bacterium]|nr:metallophosphoesterase [Chlorobiaceae bacterium]
MSIDNKVTVAHLSDLHIGGKNDIRQIARLDRMLAEFVRRGYDHVVMTGDLIDTAVPADWAIIRDALVRHGLFEWNRTTVIPGNHDLIDLEEEMRFYHALNPAENARLRRVRDRLARFSEIFRPLIADNDANAGLPFIKVMRFGDISIAFVAVSSVLPWSGADNPLGARGSVSRETLRALLDQQVVQALDGSFVMGMCHHAYRVYGTDALVDQAFDWTMEFKNRDEFLKVMKSLGVGIVLHGHFHRFQVYRADDVTFINGGSFKYASERYGEVVVNEDGSWSHRFVNLNR